MPCNSELKQFPTPTTAILILCITGNPKLAVAARSEQESCHNIAIFAECNPGVRVMEKAAKPGAFPRGVMGILLIKRATAREIPSMRRCGWAVVLLMASGLGAGVSKAGPAYTVDEAAARGRNQNPEILMAAKQLEAARGGVTEARSGRLPGVVSTGLLRKRETAE